MTETTNRSLLMPTPKTHATHASLEPNLHLVFAVSLPRTSAPACSLYGQASRGTMNTSSTLLGLRTGTSTSTGSSPSTCTGTSTRVRWWLGSGCCTDQALGQDLMRLIEHATGAGGLGIHPKPQLLGVEVDGGRVQLQDLRGGWRVQQRIRYNKVHTVLSTAGKCATHAKVAGDCALPCDRTVSMMHLMPHLNPISSATCHAVKHTH